MSAFRYQAIEGNGSAVSGVIEAEDRKTALNLLGKRGLFPSNLETCSPALRSAILLPPSGQQKPGITPHSPSPSDAQRAGARGTLSFSPPACPDSIGDGERAGVRASMFGNRISRKDITAFTREMSSLLGASIPIPQALDGLGEEEENPTLKAVVLQIADSVGKGAARSTALEEHPQLFGKLYVSMVRVGEEAGVLPKVMADLAALLEHEDEVRSEVVAAIAYPVFVLAFGASTVVFLLAV